MFFLHLLLDCALSIVLDFAGVQQNCDVSLDVSGGESKIIRVDGTAKREGRQLYLIKFLRNFVR